MFQLFRSFFIAAINLVIPSGMLKKYRKKYNLLPVYRFLNF